MPKHGFDLEPERGSAAGLTQAIGNEGKDAERSEIHQPGDQTHHGVIGAVEELNYRWIGLGLGAHGRREQDGKQNHGQELGVGHGFE